MSTTNKPVKGPTLPMLAASTRAAAEAAQERVNDGKALPASQERELAQSVIALVDRLESYRGTSVPRIAPTIDGQLVDQACIALADSRGRPMSRQDLTVRLGFEPGSIGVLGPVRLTERPLSEERRAMLRRLIAGEK